MKFPLRSVTIALAILGLHGTVFGRQVPAPVVNPPVPRTSVTVSMAEFLTPGATPPQAFAQALAAARQRQAARLIIPPGVYRMDALAGDFHLAVTDVQDLVIDGQGAEFVFTHPRGGVLIMNALRVVIRLPGGVRGHQRVRLDESLISRPQALSVVKFTPRYLEFNIQKQE